MLLSLLLNRYVIGAGIGLALLGSAYLKGHHDAASACHDAALRAQIETLNKDIAIAKSAALDEQNRANDLAISSETANRKVADYEKHLATNKGDSCPLTGDDVRRLRGIDAARP